MASCLELAFPLIPCFAQATPLFEHATSTIRLNRPISSHADSPLFAFRLDGRVAVVTGASSGLGSRFAEVLASAGAHVVLAARRTQALAASAERIKAAGGDVIAMPCDVTNDDQVGALISGTVERFGGLDILVNAAGVAPGEDEDVESTRSFREVLEVNATGTYACARAAAAVMLERGRGSIVNIASISGLVSGDGRDTPSYTASKGAVVNLTRELGVRWAAQGVRVNAIAPGWFPSEMTAETLASEEGVRWIAERTPMGRPGDPSELDGALLYLASDASTYVTGTTLVVDGGWTAR
jgi:NAD(P)-dependent dehydrogenase (short-subunit alcohol dehydrogenase family)